MITEADYFADFYCMTNHRETVQSFQRAAMESYANGDRNNAMRFLHAASELHIETDGGTREIELW